MGSDDAQQRRYNRYYARFEQPDPADSSYDLADPQSLNRYSYVQNDPVNFIDPSGLNRAGPGGGLNCYMAAAFFSDGEGGWESNAVWRCEYEGDGGSIGISGFGSGLFRRPQDSKQEDKEKDCFEFADIVADLVAKLPGAFAVEKLKERFANSGFEFGSEGFKEQFKDDPDSESRNQARHYVGGLIAGFYGYHFGGTLGQIGANLREYTFVPTPVSVGSLNILVPTVLPETKSQRVDKALNAVSTGHGAQLQSGRLSPANLADAIRKDVCM